jgi:hypothetical protein
MLYGQTHFFKTWSGNGHDHMNFYVMSATFDGVNLQAGDEVAVFDEGFCVGVGVVSNSGSLLSFVASKDDPVTSETIDGFREGNQVIVKVWDASAMVEITDINISIVSGELIFNAGRSLWFNMVLNAGCVPPAAPVTGMITHPNCNIATGSVALSGLPSAGSWTLTESPGGQTYSGTGTNYSVTGLTAGTYTYTVTDAVGCTSGSSQNVVINEQPETPNAPMVGTVTHPTDETPTGSVELFGLPSTGTWILTRNPGGQTYSGTGTTYTATGLAAGTCSFTVTNVSGCESDPSVLINIEPSPDNAVPVASKVTISGTARVGQQLTGLYTYSDADGDSEGSSFYRWLRNDSPIAGATSITYLLVEEDNGTDIKFEITPVAQSGASPGLSVQSAAEEVKPRLYALTIVVNPPVGGSTTPEPETHYYDEGTLVEITGLPDDCYLFEEWEGEVADRHNVTTEVTMDKDKTVTINFSEINSVPEFNEELPVDLEVECDSIPLAQILTATDFWGEESDIEFSEVIIEGDCENNFQLKRTWTAEDKCGNNNVHIQTISVIDNTSPVINCPPDLEVNFIENIPDTVNSIEEFIQHGGSVSDNCGLDESSLCLSSELTYITGESYFLTREYMLSDLCGNTATCQHNITVLFPMPADEISKDSFKYSVMPNPNDGKFNFRIESTMDDDIALRLMNSKGQLLEEIKIKASGSDRNIHFDASHLSKGIYYLLIQWGNYQQSEKIVIL